MKEIICFKCDEELVTKNVGFEYLGNYFSTDLLCCPKCGQVFIPEELAKGKMAQVEMALEDK